MKHFYAPLWLAILGLLVCSTGCSLFPEARQRDRIHNPFPQLKRVAVLPFFNQSSEPTLDTTTVTEAYYAALQAVPGFEVIPVGVTRTQLTQYLLQYGEPTEGKDFQHLARAMDVEAVVVGSVTDFDPFYPPRLAMTVHWYAANEGFHPIPEGYGLPWGTEQEKHIPKRIARAAEFELARSQLATQTPLAGEMPAPASEPMLPRLPEGESTPDNRGESSNPFEAFQSPGIPADDGSLPIPDEFPSAAQAVPTNVLRVNHERIIPDPLPTEGTVTHADTAQVMGMEPLPQLPPQWPDPTDLIPDPPSPHRPIATPNHRPVLSHTRIYRGDDPYFTNRLADHVETGDDARPGGWQGYLKRSDDFIRFCCHLHITEMLESRGGSDQSDLILQWPLSRY